MKTTTIMTAITLCLLVSPVNADKYSTRYMSPVSSIESSAESMQQFEMALAGLERHYEQHGASATVDLIRQHISLDPNVAEQYLSLMLTSIRDIRVVQQDVASRMLCRGGKPKYSIEKSYAVMDVLGDIRLSSLRKQYGLIKVHFGEQVQAETHNWLQLFDPSSLELPRSVETTLLEACGELEVPQFAGS